MAEKRFKYCRFCGKQFYSESAIDKFCCGEHRIKYHKAKRLKDYKPRECKWCTAVFKPMRKDQIFCSKPCKDIYWTDKRRKPNET